MEISLNVIHKRLAAASVVACWPSKVLRELTLAVDNGQSPIRQLKSKCCSTHVISAQKFSSTSQFQICTSGGVPLLNLLKSRLMGDSDSPLKGLPGVGRGLALRHRVISSSDRVQLPSVTL